MEVKAKAKYIRMSPKKIRLILDLIRGLDVLDAQEQLRFLAKYAKKPVLKVLNSAIANAEKDFNLKKENLYIKKAFADQGPTLDRWMPRAFGRAAPIRKKSSYITIFLEERVKTKVAIKKKKAEKKLEKLAIQLKKEKPPEKLSVKQEIISEKIDQKKGTDIFDERRRGKHRSKQHLDKLSLKQAKGFVKRIFRRKAV